MTQATYLSPSEVADRLGVTTAALAAMRHRGSGPVFYKPAGRVLYRWEDVERWIQSSAHTATNHPMTARA